MCDERYHTDSLGGLLIGSGLMLVLFKLTGLITWSWWWVTLPFWLPSVLALVTSGFILLWYLDKRG